MTVIPFDKVFAEKGFHSATIKDIAAEAGLAHGSIYTYFENKQALLEQGKTLQVFSQMKRASEKQAVQAAERGLVACQMEAIGSAVSDEAMRKRATSLGERIRAENGVAQAVTMIEQSGG